MRDGVVQVILHALTSATGPYFSCRHNLPKDAACKRQGENLLLVQAHEIRMPYDVSERCAVCVVENPRDKPVERRVIMKKLLDAGGICFVVVISQHDARHSVAESFDVCSLARTG